jgi:hypothetical protein
MGSQQLTDGIQLLKKKVISDNINGTDDQKVTPVNYTRKRSLILFSHQLRTTCMSEKLREKTYQK